MLLALDARNTNITIGVFDGPVLANRWRLRTIREQTAIAGLTREGFLKLVQEDGQERIVLAGGVRAITTTDN